ncbi:MAG: mannitol dehydrogenase family protein, partial [Roseiarcus sp.]
PSWERLQTSAKRARSDPRAFLELRDIFGGLAENPHYVGAFSNTLSALWARGVRSTLADYLSDKP